MTDIIQNIYLISAFIGILAMIPQIRKLIVIKQSDGLSLTTWSIWASHQIVSLIYAISIDAKGYIVVNAVWLGFYWIMVSLIIKYRKRRSLFETFLYWNKRGRGNGKNTVPFPNQHSYLHVKELRKNVI